MDNFGNTMKTFLLVCFAWLFLNACTATYLSTYQQLSRQTKIEEIVDNFITEIEFHPMMYVFFKDSNIDRFVKRSAGTYTS